MRLILQDGTPVIEAAEIAPLMDLDVSAFRTMMQAGRITTRVERGTADDEGELRVTFQSPLWRVRLTCSTDGSVLSTTRVRRGHPRQAGDLNGQAS